jgi:hypothetical protein
MKTARRLWNITGTLRPIIGVSIELCLIYLLYTQRTSNNKGSNFLLIWTKIAHFSNIPVCPQKTANIKFSSVFSYTAQEDETERGKLRVECYSIKTFFVDLIMSHFQYTNPLHINRNVTYKGCLYISWK